MENNNGFKSNFGFLMAAVGSAVGLGNIWGFPNKMGSSGGAVFLIVYILLAIFCGFVVMVGELALGRKTGEGPIGAYNMVSKKFKWLGWIATASPFLILTFYCALGGYCLKYIVVNVGNLLNAGFGTGGLGGADVFTGILTNQTEGIVYGLIFVVLTLIIVLGGVAGGIEKVCAVGMPALFVMLLISIIRAWTLPGAMDGLKFMFIPGWGVANGVIEEAPSIIQVIATAGGQMFFSLSLGMGVMIAYGSYLNKKENIVKNSVLIVCMDSMVALMAGLCVLPARFALDPTGNIGGPKLLFITMQNVFDRMGGFGPIFGIIFYVLVAFAAISSSISLLEAVISQQVKNAEARGEGNKRVKYAVLYTIPIAILCALVCADGLGSNGIAPKDIFNLTSSANWCSAWLEFFDAISEGIFMPLGALLMCIMLGYETGTDLVRNEVEASGVNFGIYKVYRFCVRVVTPILVAIVLYGQLAYFFGLPL